MSAPKADFIENKKMRGDGDRHPWVHDTCEAMKAKGATFFRVSHPIDQADDMWLEGWRVQPDDQGPHPWEVPVVRSGPANTDPGPLRVVPSTEGAKVYCVICMDGDHARDLVHVFSTQDLAQAFADADTTRNHVLYDYVIDCPERMEGRTQ